jgi:hypothetical protein
MRDDRIILLELSVLLCDVVTFKAAVRNFGSSVNFISSKFRFNFTGLGV